MHQTRPTTLCLNARMLIPSKLAHQNANFCLVACMTMLLQNDVTTLKSYTYLVPYCSVSWHTIIVSHWWGLIALWYKDWQSSSCKLQSPHYASQPCSWPWWWHVFVVCPETLSSSTEHAVLKAFWCSLGTVCPANTWHMPSARGHVRVCAAWRPR